MIFFVILFLTVKNCLEIQLWGGGGGQSPGATPAVTTYTNILFLILIHI